VIRFPRLMAGLILASLAPQAAHAAGPVPPVSPAAPVTPCPTGEAGAADAPLPGLAGAVRHGGTLDILAVGAGPASAAPEHGQALPPGVAGLGPGSFLGQVAQDLETGAPGLHTSLTIRGGRGLGAPDQLNIIKAALAQHHYKLVLWQTGTLDAVQAAPADSFYQALADGADAVSSAGAELVLVEPQYSRFLSANTDIGPYLAAMEAAGALPNTLLFHRYDLMHDWEESGLIDLEDAAPADRLATATRLHACLAEALARALLPGYAGRSGPH